MRTWARIASGAGLGVVALLGTFATMVACTSARRGEALGRPIVISDPMVLEGRDAFFQHCHHCHPFGDAGLGPAILDKPLPDFLMRMQVRHGFGPMPAFDEEELPDERLDALLAWIDAAKDA